MRQLRGFKYRFYPTGSQRLELAQTFGCARFVYNWALALRSNSYYQDDVALSYTDTSNALTKLKKDPEKHWLKQVSSKLAQLIGGFHHQSDVTHVVIFWTSYLLTSENGLVLAVTL